MTTNCDAIVLGAGVMGSAAAWSLAQRGQRVLVLEQFGPVHDRGSSHGVTRITRKAYFEHPDYVPLVDESNRLWRKLENDSGSELLHETGLLLFGPEEGPIIRGTRLAQQQHGWPIESLTAGDCRERFPGFAIPDDASILFEPEAGLLRVEESVAALQQAAERQGAVFHWQESVRDWQCDGDNVVVRTDRETYTACRLVVCAGAWSRQLLASLDVELTILRKPQFWFSVRDGAYAAANGTPIFGYEIDGHFFYGFPSVDGATIKVAEHLGKEVVTNPDDVRRDVGTVDCENVHQFAQKHLQITTPTPVRSSVCMYTMTRDEHFIVDQHPQRCAVCFAAGFSGHGYKFAPYIGELLAGLATEAAVDAVPAMWRLSRPSLR